MPYLLPWARVRQRRAGAGGVRDGGFMFAVGELATIAQERLPVTVLLVNDGGYGMLRYDPATRASRSPVRTGGAGLRPTGHAFGIPATHVTGVGLPLEKALGRALASYEPMWSSATHRSFPQDHVAALGEGG